MLAITAASSSTLPPLLTPNLLPCALNHNGPIAISPRHWNPTTVPSSPATDSSSKSSQPAPTTPAPQMKEAYFRGRRLLSRPLPLPPAYEGLVLETCDTPLPHRKRGLDEDAPTGRRNGITKRRAIDLAGSQESEEEDEEELEEPIEVKPLEKKARFDQLVVWGHEAVPGEKGGEDDVYAKGVEEWIRFAEVMHRFEDCD